MVEAILETGSSFIHMPISYHNILTSPINPCLRAESIRESQFLSGVITGSVYFNDTLFIPEVSEYSLALEREHYRLAKTVLDQENRIRDLEERLAKLEKKL